MDCKKKTTGRLVCAVAAGVIALAPMAHARRHHKKSDTTTSTDTATSSTTTGGSSTMSSTSGSSMDSSMASSTPTQVTGTVLRYYVDRTGYVTAMDVQTANGVDMVRFPPGMGQRIYSTYPVGGQASVWVMGSPYGTGSTRWDVVGMGNTMPTVMMQPYMVSDVDLLEAEPYIQAGTKLMTFEGTLRRFVTSNTGEVIGIVVSNPHMSSMMNRHMKAGMTNTSMSTGGSTGGMMSSDMSMMSGDVLVRVPREERQIDPGSAGTARRAPLFRGSDVEVTGYPESPRYGVLSVYPNRVAATALVVNGRAVGAVGFPRMTRRRGETLFGFDFMGTGKTRTPEQMNAAQMGYQIYDPSMMSTGTGSMNGTGTTPGTSGGTTSSSTATGTSQ